MSKDKQAALPENNWWGKLRHPSDELVHWRDVGRPYGSKDFEKDNDQLRTDWDLLNSTPELAAAFQRTKTAIIDKTEADEAENNAGEDL